MRVIAGTARGLRLDAPPGRSTRPTLDRVRESIFNALTSADLLAGSVVLDAFAGSGALGIEALSRGAEACVFVERDRAALAALRSNLERTRLADRSTVVPGDAFALLGSSGRLAGRSFGLALLDPPYGTEEWAALLGCIRAETVVIESDHVVDPGDGWRVRWDRRYGGTLVRIAERAARGPADNQEPAS